MGIATAEDVAKLREVLAPYTRVLILTHSNPDPDALASAAAMRFIAGAAAGKPSAIGYGGFLSRAENREMVERLRLPVRCVDELDLRRFRAIILVDAQPGAGNVPLSATQRVVAVVDHHPLRRATRECPFALVDAGAGSTSTLCHELLKAADLKPNPALATALYFGIKTDTQDLGRETTARDTAAYKELFGLAQHRKLAQIMHPRLPLDYYRAVSKALESAIAHGPVLYVPLGEVTTPEYVSEIADYMVMLEGTRWAVATGHYRGNLYFSLRSLTARKDAGRLLRKAIGASGVAGGHQKMAGGIVPLAHMEAGKREAVELRIVDSLIAALGAASTTPVMLLGRAPAGEAPTEASGSAAEPAEAPIPCENT